MGMRILYSNSKLNFSNISFQFVLIKGKNPLILPFYRTIN